jgi:hypothetical protein
VFKPRSHLTCNVGSSLLINAGFCEIDAELSELHKCVLSAFIERRNQDVLELKLLFEVTDHLTNVLHFSVVYSLFEMDSNSSVAGFTCVGSRTV